MSYTSPKFNGEPSVEALANGLATLGRYGDEYMVHATDGETLIPPQIFEANPKLKEDLFVQMRKMGVQDPNRFVVGNSLNSINPITGQPEFFFKKIFKAVKKVFKKALPYIAPIVGNMIAPGIGGIIASALATKLQGGSWGDVAKGAALSYGLGALGQGLTSGKGFMTGLGEGLMAPIHAGSNLFSGGAKNPLAQGIFGTGGQLFGQSTDLGLGFSGGDVARSEGVGGLIPTYQKDPMMASGFFASQPQHLQSLNAPADQVPFREMGWRQKQAMTSGPLSSGGLDQLRLDSQNQAQDLLNKEVLTRGSLRPEWQTVEGQKALADNIYDQNVAQLGDSSRGVGTDFTTSGTYPRKAALPASQVVDAATGTATAAPRLWEGAGGETAAKMLGEYGVPVALAGLTYLLAKNDELPEDELPQGQAANQAYADYLTGKQADPNFKNTPEGQRLLALAGIVPSTDPVALARATGATEEEARTWLGSMYGQPTAVAAKGGIITLQGGGEIMGPGSGTSDSIPARLSDGEFVMTADAVRGAGNGSRDMGAARMYDLMSRFERAA